jgi:adenosine/AMP kinase
LFSVPGAFTPSCQAKHLPPYVEHYEDFKKKGVDVIGVISANDAFVIFLFQNYKINVRYFQLGLKSMVEVIKFSALVILEQSFQNQLDGLRI